MKKPQKTEPDLLIESMQKLIDHMNDNKTHQEEIFQSLTPTDVQKILSNFEDKSPIMRKTSAAFLCELVFNNPIVQKGFCDITNILPMDGKICVNKIPQNLLSQVRHIPDMFEAIKVVPIPYDQDQNYPLCWYFENQKDKMWKKGVKFIKFEKNNQNAKQTIQNFVDPQLHLFGFIIANKKQPQLLQQIQQETEESQVRAQPSKSSHEQKRTPIQKKPRPISGSTYSPMNSVSPMIKRTRQLNTSVDIDHSVFVKQSKDNEHLTTIEELVNKPLKPQVIGKKPIHTLGIRKLK